MLLKRDLWSIKYCYCCLIKFCLSYFIVNYVFNCCMQYVRSIVVSIVYSMIYTFLTDIVFCLLFS